MLAPRLPATANVISQMDSRTIPDITHPENFHLGNYPHWLYPTKISHGDVIKWKHFPRYWQFVGGIHRGPVNSPHTGQWRGALMFSLISTRINGWVSNGEARDLRRHRPHYDVIVMSTTNSILTSMYCMCHCTADTAMNSITWLINQSAPSKCNLGVNEIISLYRITRSEKRYIIWLW